MLSHVFIAVALAYSIAGSMAQSAATTTANPLNNFISIAASAASVVNSQNSAEATASSSSGTHSQSSATSATASAAATSSPSKSSPDSHKNTIIIAVVVVVGVLLLALILGLICCCFRRRRRSRLSKHVSDDDASTGLHPHRSTDSGRAYSPVAHYGRGPSMEQRPTVPDMAMVNHPNIAQHPAHRPVNPFSQESAVRPQNPFVPVPPSPRRASHSKERVTDSLLAGVAGAGAVGAYEARDNHTGSRQVNAPMTTRNHSPSPRTSFLPAAPPPRGILRNASDSREGLADDTVRTSEGHAMAQGRPSNNSRARSQSRGRSLTDLNTSYNQGTLPARSSAQHPRSVYGNIGSPADDMHVHVLQGYEPSRELHESLSNRESMGRPRVPSRSPLRSRFADSSTSSSEGLAGTMTSSNSNSGSGDDWRNSQIGTVGTSNTSSIPSNNIKQRSHSRSPRRSMQAPPVPWENSSRRSSISPRQSMGSAPWAQAEGNLSGSPGQSTFAGAKNGQDRGPRRLRFSDIEQDNGQYGHHDHFGGVGEAL